MLQQQEESKSKQPGIKTYQILIPALLGIGVIVWLFFDEFDLSSFSEISFDIRSMGFILLAFLLILTRDFGMMTRFRLMTNKELSWKQAFNINILRELGCAVMPGAVGSGPTVIILLSKEGINAGRATTIATINLFLDNLFSVVICPVIFLFVPLDELFNQGSVVSATINVVFWTVYPLLCIWTFILFAGLFVRPAWIVRLLRSIFKLRLLKRWEKTIYDFSENLLNASIEIKKRPFTFWIKIFMVTALTWSARFLVANALFMAFTHVDNPLVIFGRQVIIWLSMGISPTPGGSGLNEIAFKEFYSDLALGSASILVIITLWRIITYYIYLFVGTIILPRWVKKKFTKKKKVTIKEIPVAEEINV